MVLYGVSAGLNAGTAGYSTSYSTTYSTNGYAYTTVTQHYDANAAYQANMASTNHLITLGQMMDNDRVVKEQGYLKKNNNLPRRSSNRLYEYQKGKRTDFNNKHTCK